MPQKLCQFYNPATGGGCRNGGSCRFLHLSPSDSQNQSSTVATGRHNETADGRNKGILFSPRGVCSYFWNKGSCDKGFSCRFNHSANPEIERRDRPEEGVLSLNALLPLLTEAGLAKVAGPGSDAYFTPKFQTPMKVQSNLQHFLREDFRFVRPSQVYKFVALLYSASANDPSWVRLSILRFFIKPLKLCYPVDRRWSGMLHFIPMSHPPQFCIQGFVTPDGRS
jgi:hypothetical protein